jgi:hypothetical protein
MTAHPFQPRTTALAQSQGFSASAANETSRGARAQRGPRVREGEPIQEDYSYDTNC